MMARDRKRRVTVDEFRNLVFEYVGRDSGFRFSQLEEIADNLGVNIPTEIRSPLYRERRGIYTLNPDGNVGLPDVPENGNGKANGNGHSDVFLTVSVRNKLGQWQRPPANVIQEVRQRIQGTVTEDGRVLMPRARPLALRTGGLTPVLGSSLDPDEHFQHLADLVDMTVKGDNNALLIHGGPGVGKTQTVMNVLEGRKLIKDTDWVLAKGKTTARRLYVTLFMNREKLIVFDDCDSMWADREMRNMLKGALDSYDKRIIQWDVEGMIPMIGKSAADREKVEAAALAGLMNGNDKTPLPNQFEFFGRVIFVSNMERHKFDSAVLDRCFNIDMTLTPENVFKRIESVMADIGGDRFKSISLKKRREILDELKAQWESGKLKNPSLRSFVSAMRIVKAQKNLALLRYS